MKIFKFAIGIIILGLFTYFAAANSHMINLDMSIQESAAGGFSLPAFLLVYLLFCFGFATAWILASGTKRSFKRTTKKLNKQIAEQEEELTKLRNLPVTNSQDTSENDHPNETPELISNQN